MMISKERILDILISLLNETYLDAWNDYTLDESFYTRKTLRKIITIIEKMD